MKFQVIVRRTGIIEVESCDAWNACMTAMCTPVEDIKWYDEHNDVVACNEVPTFDDEKEN